MKPDQNRVRTMLADTITLLCKNGLQFKRELRIQGVIGVTIDENDIFIVHINENYADASISINMPSDGVNACAKDSVLPVAASKLTVVNSALPSTDCAKVSEQQCVRNTSVSGEMGSAGTGDSLTVALGSGPSSSQARQHLMPPLQRAPHKSASQTPPSSGGHESYDTHAGVEPHPTQHVGDRSSSDNMAAITRVKSEPMEEQVREDDDVVYVNSGEEGEEQLSEQPQDEYGYDDDGDNKGGILQTSGHYLQQQYSQHSIGAESGDSQYQEMYADEQGDAEYGGEYDDDDDGAMGTADDTGGMYEATDDVKPDMSSLQAGERSWNRSASASYSGWSASQQQYAAPRSATRHPTPRATSQAQGNTTDWTSGVNTAVASRYENIAWNSASRVPRKLGTTLHSTADCAPWRTKRVTSTQFVCNICSHVFYHQPSLLRHQIQRHGRPKMIGRGRKPTTT